MKQCEPLQVHARLHLSGMRQQVIALDTGFRNPHTTLEPVLHSVREPSPMVVSLVKDLLKVPPTHWDSLIELFRKQLSYRAYTLVRAIEDELKNRRCVFC